MNQLPDDTDGQPAATDGELETGGDTSFVRLPIDPTEPMAEWLAII
ncbi:hypothetical protein [Actinomadura opuntiae]|nr:hypothetical protein [Actinomadura sp. OS1-43]MDL4818636.1 hypothetical protein [Actinomadura sp. OS1-43]